MALNYDALTATTRKYYMKPLADNVFNDLPTLRYFTRKAKAAPGGEKLVQPLIYAKNEARGSFRGYDVLNVAPTDERRLRSMIEAALCNRHHFRP